MATCFIVTKEKNITLLQHNHIIMQKTSSLTLLVSSLLLVSCASSGTTPTTSATSTSSNINSARPALESKSIDKAMKKALAQAEAAQDKAQVIGILEQIHNRNPEDAIIATRYARALREDDQIQKAVQALRPFADTETPNVEAITEMAMAQLGTGDYEAAKLYGLKSTVIAPKNARGYLALGTAQDALKDHANAEQSFRQGLKYWKGDPSPILNNLALNLASQGHLEESLSLLERALKIAPRRMELERNRRIIATLVETSSPMAPAPYKKPDIIIPDTAKPAPKKEDVKQNIAEEAVGQVEVQTKEEIEEVIEQATPNKPIKVNIEGVTSLKMKTNLKVKSTGRMVND